jgi:hypothetical protein
MSTQRLAQRSYRRLFIATSGYRPLYRTGLHCPSCGGGSWIVGRASAQCGHCATALPLAPVDDMPLERTI